MKRLFIGKELRLLFVFVLPLLSTNYTFCQVDTLPNPAQYLYSDFTRARVATKVGKDLNMLANYNIVTEMVVFLQKGVVYDLIDYHNVDTIYFKDATFIPGEKVFYELAEAGQASLLIRHTGTIQDPPKPAAYGGTSEVSSSTYINNLPLGNNVYRLKNETSLIIKPKDDYLIGLNGEVLPFRSEKQFAAIFPDYRNELRDFIKTNKTKFDREEDLIKLVRYCNSLRK